MTDIQYIDDLTLSAECLLFRRIPVISDPATATIVWDDNLGRWRPSSAAFTDSRDGHPMSVVIESELQVLGRDPASVLKGHEGFALAAITVGLTRELKQMVVKDPTPEEPAHGLVVGDKRKAKSKMAINALWVIPVNLAPPDSAKR